MAQGEDRMGADERVVRRPGAGDGLASDAGLGFAVPGASGGTKRAHSSDDADADEGAAWRYDPSDERERKEFAEMVRERDALEREREEEMGPLATLGRPESAYDRANYEGRSRRHASRGAIAAILAALVAAFALLALLMTLRG